MADDTKAPAPAGDLELAKLKPEPSSSSIDPKNRSDSFLKKKEKKDKEKEEDNHHLKAAKSQANQAKILRENRFFAAARSGTVYDFKDAVGDPKKPRVDITARGAFGETVLHIACLFANFPVMRYIVENFPQLTNLTYENQPYLGETALHICLVQADVDAVEFLLDHGANVNDCNCNGDFFKPKPPVGKIYMGEHPLTFAACVESEKSKEMIRLLIKHGARFDNVDDYGNNILHVLVIKDKPEMYDYIMDLYDLYKKPDWANIEEMTNKQMRTPLGLASALAKGEMFETILRRRKETLWIYGPIAQSAYPLKEVDTYRGPVRRPPTALELVVYLSGEAGVTEENYLDRCDLLTKMPMKELVDSKWSIFAKRFFYGYFLFYIAYLVIFTLAVARFSFLLEADGATPNRAMAGLEITVLVFVALFIAMEIYDLIFLRLRYFTEKGSNFFFGITWINAAFIYLAFFLRMSEDSYPNLNVKLAEEICTAFAAFFSWFYLLYFFRGWKSLGFFAIAIREILANDIVKFAIIYLILSTGFALVFMVMFRDSGLPGFTNLGWAMFSMFNLLTGDGSSIDPSQAHSAGFTQFAQAIYTILMAILLLNMLIAMMGGTYSSITEKSEKQHVLERVSLILFIERRFIFPIQYLKNLYRSGQPAADAGLAGTDYYLLLQEKTNWGASAASGRRKFVFKNAVKKVISALRMRKNINKDPSKRESMIAIQRRREEELERLRKRKEEEAKKKAEKEKEKDFLDIPGMFNEMGEFVDEMAFIGYEGDEQIGGAN